MTTVVIIGGGVAGLAAAVACVDAGHRVTLLEARSFCGGRAYSFADPNTGEIIDNGQHLLMGCYTATFDYLARIGARGLVHVDPTFQVDFVQPGGERTVLRCPRLPAPWHLLCGLLRWPAFRKRDLWRLVRGVARDCFVGLRLPRTDSPDISVAEWLDRMEQSQRARELLWEPLTVAVMNETMERAAAAPFLAMLREGMQVRGVLQGLAFPRAPLSQIFVDPALEYLTARGAQVRTATTITKLDHDAHHIHCLHTRQGESIMGDAIILALPPREVHRLMTASGLGEQAPWQQLAAWESVPIISVHLWYPQPILPAPMVGLLGSAFHWAFDKSGKTGTVPFFPLSNTDAHCVALVSSACRDMAVLPREEIVQAAQQAMQQYFPAARALTPQHVQVTKELHATISLGKGTAALRLPTHTNFRNLLLAGDWTQTYLPATLEGAVRSGCAAARAVV